MSSDRFLPRRRGWRVLHGGECDLVFPHIDAIICAAAATVCNTSTAASTTNFASTVADRGAKESPPPWDRAEITARDTSLCLIYLDLCRNDYRSQRECYEPFAVMTLCEILEQRQIVVEKKIVYATLMH